MSDASNLDEGLGCGCFLILCAIAFVIISRGGELVRAAASLLDRMGPL